MGFIVQMQRRAIESLVESGDKPVKIDLRKRYYLGRHRIFLLGISEGIGTCADLHGSNMAVFGYGPPDPYRSEYTKKLLEKNSSCLICVLVRTSRKEERAGDDIKIRAVQKIRIKNFSKKCVVFAKEEKSAIYAPM